MLKHILKIITQLSWQKMLSIWQQNMCCREILPGPKVQPCFMNNWIHTSLLVSLITTCYGIKLTLFKKIKKNYTVHLSSRLYINSNILQLTSKYVFRHLLFNCRIGRAWEYLGRCEIESLWKNVNTKSMHNTIKIRYY